jgi:hypothetical protein
MSSSKYIKQAAKSHQNKCVANSPNRNWVVGLTNVETRRYGEHKRLIGHDPRHWRCWECDSYEEALKTEKYFYDNGYNVGLGGTALDSTILYMYYLPQNKDAKKKT